ncbi:sensor histidine kinase [Larkinella bovis]|uniref:histidine kinase n=1 Tax=Larkinella bovis TaxID=683041 RepID=A0ABW0I7S1_9BACT
MKFVTDLLIPVLVSALMGQGIISLLRRFINTTVRLPRWDIWLRRFWLSAFGFILLDLLIATNEYRADDWYFISVILAVILTLILSRHYRPSLILLVAMLPITLFILAIVFLFTFDYGEQLASLWAYISVGFGFSALWLVAFVVMAYRQRKTIESERLARLENERILKANEAQKAELERLVVERTAIIQQQKEALEHALAQLKATQDQLIQSEKLASLGSLTAGIAHEIQNPLNFVTNFADVSTELIQEMREEVTQLEQAGPVLPELLGFLDDNLRKITHHGQRASAIVKGMLEHSRSYNGERELTDLNALADEYSKLAYNGFRAKNKAFQVELVRQTDPVLAKVPVVPQEIGRVLLNLLDNAFYAVFVKKQRSGGSYHPTVTISTRQQDGRIEMRIGDNGTGIDNAIQPKLFQPFFTTKPTGEGTGLGLSLSYDIITKGHRGTLSVQSQPGEGTEFIISLPIT